MIQPHHGNQKQAASTPSPRRYDWPPNDHSFTAIRSPSLRRFANTLRKYEEHDSEKDEEDAKEEESFSEGLRTAEEWHNQLRMLARSNRRNLSVGLGTRVSGEMVSPVRTRRTNKKVKKVKKMKRKRMTKMKILMIWSLVQNMDGNEP